MSSLTRIPLDSANVDIFSGLTKSVLKFNVSEDIVNSIYEFPQHPDKLIALVESEKTAIICSGLITQYLWLAIGGKSQLSPQANALVANLLTLIPTLIKVKRHLPSSLRSEGNLLYPPHGREYEDCKQILKLSLKPTHNVKARARLQPAQLSEDLPLWA